MMNSAVASTPITAAQALASIASAPSVGPTVRCSMTSTGTGNAPPWTSAARSLASASLNCPVICVDPPVMPTWHCTLGSTCGEEITLSSSTIATRRPGSPGGLQAASPVSLTQDFSPLPLKSTLTCHSAPICWSRAAVASLTPSPVSPAGPSRSFCPDSSAMIRSPFAGLAFLSPAATTFLTGWKVSCAVRPMTSAACRGSCTPGSSTMMRLSPVRLSVGSDTPSASTRLRSTSSARSVASDVALVFGPSRVSSTICVPPRRSRPRLAGFAQAKYADEPRMKSASSARTRVARDTGVASVDGP